MAALSDDILTEICCYLPTKSIGCLRCVSRSWCAALSSASFLDLYRRRANKPGQLKVFFSTTDKTSEEGGSCFYSWQPGGVAAKKLTPHRFHRPTPLTSPLHGLVLIRCPNTGYHVCNPSTGQSLALPDTRLPAKITSWPQFYDRDVAYGLGYCPVTDEYKVVRLFSSSCKGGKLTCCEIFVLGAPSYWRPTAQRPPAFHVKGKNPGVFVGGCLHFLCYGDGYGDGIISFNISSETFGGAMELPSNPSHASVRMIELDGCLCVYHKNVGHRHGSCNIWVLRSHTKQRRQWEQLCRLDSSAWTYSVRAQLQSSWMAPLAMYDGDNGERRIMFDTGACKVFSVNVPNGDALEILFNPLEDEAIVGNFPDYGEPRLGLFEEGLAPME